MQGKIIRSANADLKARLLGGPARAAEAPPPPAIARRAFGLPAAERVVEAAPPVVVQPAPAKPAKPAPAATDADSRRAPRKSGNIPGLVMFEGTRTGTPCSVIDMSATGARLKFPARGAGYTDPINLPTRFWLQLKLDRMQVECEMVRCKGEEVGVRFCSVPVPMEKVVPSIKRLVRLPGK